MIDCSSGGNYSDQKIELKPGYQVPLSKSIKENVEILTGAVGLITEKDQAEEVLDNNEADVIFLGRELLRNPYWTLYASGEIDEWPLQYQRSFEGSKKSTISEKIKIYSKPVYGTRTSGISIDPSAFCPFSIIKPKFLEELNQIHSKYEGN